MASPHTQPHIYQTQTKSTIPVDVTLRMYTLGRFRISTPRRWQYLHPWLLSGPLGKCCCGTLTLHTHLPLFVLCLLATLQSYNNLGPGRPSHPPLPFHTAICKYSHPPKNCSSSRGRGFWEVFEVVVLSWLLLLQSYLRLPSCGPRTGVFTGGRLNSIVEGFQNE